MEDLSEYPEPSINETGKNLIPRCFGNLD